MGFVSEHPFLGAAAFLALLTADFFDAGYFRRHPAGLQLFNFIEQQPPGKESIESLLTRCLALDLETSWPVEQHDARGRLVDILAAMSPGPHKSLFYVGLSHSQSGHALGELLCLFRIHGKRGHWQSLVEEI